jgi:hypothetical protein
MRSRLAGFAQPIAVVTDEDQVVSNIVQSPGSMLRVLTRSLRIRRRRDRGHRASTQDLDRWLWWKRLRAPSIGIRVGRGVPHHGLVGGGHIFIEVRERVVFLSRTGRRIRIDIQTERQSV